MRHILGYFDSSKTIRIMTRWALTLHYFFLLGSTVKSSTLKHYLQFLRRQDHGRRDLRLTRMSSRYNVDLHNISIDEEKLCKVKCATHFCNSVDLVQSSLCTIKDRVQNDFQIIDDTSRNVWSELPTSFDSTIVQNIEDVLSKAFTAIHALQQPFWNESETSVLAKKMTILSDTSITGVQPIQVKLISWSYSLIAFMCVY